MHLLGVRGHGWHVLYVAQVRIVNLTRTRRTKAA